MGADLGGKMDGRANGVGVASFDTVEAERHHLNQVALTIDQGWGEFISMRAELAALGEQDGDQTEHDPVRSLLAEARARLHRAHVEVVVSGYLNRGKSTLLNALLGVEVSSTRVTPETARPVYVRYGERRAWVAYPAADGPGEVLEDVDAGDAAAYGGLRTEETSDTRRKPLRVIQQLPIDLLRSGVILKDTPGLDDANPQLAQELENLTLAELDRATATIMVLSCPPGLSGSELGVLAGLDARRVDKVFLVCNFHTDQWEDEDEKGEVLDHVRRSISGTTAEGSRLYAVHAKRAWRARLAGDAEAYEASGVALLERDLERYLAEGVYRQVLDRSTAFLQAARTNLLDRIDERLALLRDPGLLASRRAEKQAAVDAARSRLDEIANEVSASINGLASRVMPEIAGPFHELAAAVGAATSNDDLTLASMRFDAQYEAALARVSVTVRESLVEVEHRAKAQLTQAFDHPSEGQLDLYRQGDHFQFARVSSQLAHKGGPDWNDVWFGAAAGAIAGGAIAGGAGLALLAAGPVGWLAGAAMGFLLGGSLLLGLSTPSIGPGDRARLLEQVNQQHAAAASGLRQQLSRAAEGLEQELRSRLGDYAAGELAELAAVQAIVDDTHRRTELETATEAIRARAAGLRLA